MTDLIPDWDRYEREVARNTEQFRSEIEESGKALFEYGVLLIKHLLLLNGGALVALPAIASVLPEDALANVPNSAFCFVVGLILAFVCGYFTHVNWVLQNSAHIELRNQRARELAYVYLGPDFQEHSKIESDRINKQPHKRSIWWTFSIAHVTGIASLLSLFLGCYQLF